MNIKSLARHLENIESGKPVNLPAFLKLIDSLSIGLEVAPSDIQAIKSGKAYIVTDIKPSLLSELKRLSCADLSSRKGAAIQNKSHSVRVDGSMLLLRKGGSHPEVVMFKPDGSFIRQSTESPKLLVVENRQCFINLQQSLRLINKLESIVIDDDTDVLFAEGNQINNSLHRPFLRRYEEIYAFLDIDLGGLKIAHNMLTLLGTDSSAPSFHFVLPNNIDELLKNVVETKSTEYLNKVADIGMKAGSLSKPASKILLHRKTLEQEAFLYE